MQLALTIDDAPTIAESGVPSDPNLMDRMREELVAAGVADCVAFVVGERAIGHEAKLERWLKAGFRLANHTFHHRRASVTPIEETLESIARCDALLKSVGAFDDYRRWFRFPYLDRGASAEHRKTLQGQIQEMGYQIAHASVDFFDYRFDPIIAAQLRTSPATAAITEQRFVEVAVNSTRYAYSSMKRAGREAPQISYCHFSPISHQQIGRIIRKLRASGFLLVPFETAAENAAFREFDSNFKSNGLVSNAVRFPLPERLFRKLFPKLESLSPRANGPRWPYLG